jgi:hypothetical protein
MDNTCLIFLLFFSSIFTIQTEILLPQATIIVVIRSVSVPGNGGQSNPISLLLFLQTHPTALFLSPSQTKKPHLLSLLSLWFSSPIVFVPALNRRGLIKVCFSDISFVRVNFLCVVLVDRCFNNFTSICMCFSVYARLFGSDRTKELPNSLCFLVRLLFTLIGCVLTG